MLGSFNGEIPQMPLMENSYYKGNPIFDRGTPLIKENIDFFAHKTLRHNYYLQTISPYIHLKKYLLICFIGMLVKNRGYLLDGVCNNITNFFISQKIKKIFSIINYYIKHYISYNPEVWASKLI